MKNKELNKKSISELNAELLNLLREQFNLRTRLVSGHLRQTNLLKKIRCDIARIKTLITAKKVNVRNDQ